MTVLKTVTDRIFTFTKAVGGDATWTFLGTIDGNGLAQRSELPMTDFVSRDIMIRFMSRGAQMIPPEIDRFEIEYMPIGQLFRSYSARVMAINGIIDLMGVKENSGAFIQATLFSVAEVQRRFVVAFPAPGAVGHTARVQISINDPGAQWTGGLAYKDVNGNPLDNIGTSIPVQFDML